jgi:glycosidase
MKDLFSEIAATSGQYTFKKEGEPMRTFPQKYAIAIDSLLASQAQEYPKDSYLMNMITNHDLNSWEGTEFERLGNLSDAFAVLSYTLPGMPLIYTGQETGMNRAFEFFKKDEAPAWEPRNEYFTFYQKLNALKHNEAALAAGEAGGEMVRYATQSLSLYAFSRTKGDSSVVVIVNLGSHDEYLTFNGKEPDLTNMVNYFTGKPASIPEDYLMKAGEYLVFVNK